MQETGSGLIDASVLTTSSKGGQEFNNANNITLVNATNTTSGDISLTNTSSSSELTILGITERPAVEEISLLIMPRAASQSPAGVEYRVRTASTLPLMRVVK